MDEAKSDSVERGDVMLHYDILEIRKAALLNKRYSRDPFDKSRACAWPRFLGSENYCDFSENG